MRTWILCLHALLVVTSIGWGLAAELPVVRPDEVGLSSERLGRVTAVLEQAVASGELPGAVALVARDGRVAYLRSFGMADRARGRPMTTDAIFRIYSMTKPIVSVAAMSLVEEGKLALYEPVAKYVPEFASARVAVESEAPAGGRGFREVPATRPITVHDLLRHTSGLTYGTPPGRTAVKDLYRQAGIGAIEDMYQETGESQTRWTNATFAAAIARLPLQFEPGTTWDYGHSTDVLGRVVEVVSGQPLDAFLAARVLGPLGMQDTGFVVPPARASRLAQPQPDPRTGTVPFLIDVTRRNTWHAGGHGLASTVPDYFRFCLALLNRGALEGVRILGARTVAWMTSNHLTPSVNPGPAYLPGPGYGFGLGFAVRLETGLSDWPGSVGDYFWGGYAGTYFWIDPRERLIGILMFQDPARRQHYRMLFRATVMQALVE